MSHILVAYTVNIQHFHLFLMTGGIANGQSQPITVVYTNQRRKKPATEGNKA